MGRFLSDLIDDRLSTRNNSSSSKPKMTDDVARGLKEHSFVLGLQALKGARFSPLLYLHIRQGVQYP